MSRYFMSVPLAALFLLAVPDAGAAAGQKKKAAKSSGVEWVALPGGRYVMGAEDLEDAQPARQVTVKDLKLSKTPVTVAQYAECVKAGRCTSPDALPECNWGKPGREDHPVNCVDWEQAAQFAVFAGGRLPTEAEWEFAAKSRGRRRLYPWGEEPPSEILTAAGSPGTVPVCSRPAGNTEQGLCDMSGSVWQWVQDFYRDTYAGGPVDGSAYAGPCEVRGGAGRCTARVIRGGAFNSRGEGFRSDSRGGAGPDIRRAHIGFRVAR